MANINWIKWIEIIAEILIIIARGIPKKVAVSMASEKFGVSESEIWAHGGF